MLKTNELEKNRAKYCTDSEFRIYNHLLERVILSDYLLMSYSNLLT